MKNIIRIVLTALLAIPSFGQSISIFDIDTTNFPTMKAKFYAFDKDGKPTTPNISDMKLTENGVSRKITNISCPPVKLNSISVGIMVDTYNYIGLARAGTQRLIDFLQMPNDELGITYMAKGVYIYQDFTKSKSKALDKASSIPSAPGVDINSMFNSPVTGGMPFIKDRKNDKKVLILISDLHCPNLTIDENRLIQEAKANGISIYSILLGTNDYSGLFTRIAGGTGGRVFERVANENHIYQIFEEIKNVYAYEPCSVEWEGGFSCIENKIKVDFYINNQNTNNIYKQPYQAIANIKLINPVVSFGRVTVGKKVTKSLRLYPINTNIIINNIKNSKGSSLFKIINSFPIYVNRNDTCIIDIEYEQIDSSAEFVLFEIETKFCNLLFTANGGYFEKPKKLQTLKLTHPNGGENFVVGNNEIITWEGISKQDTVILEYSFDGGKTWNIITNEATNLSYQWKNIPRPTSKSCLMKVSQLYNNNVGNTQNVQTLEGHSSEIRDFAFTNDDFTLYSCDNFGLINIWDINSGINTGNLNNNKYYAGGFSSRMAINNDNTQLVITTMNDIISFNLVDKSFMYKQQINFLQSYLAGIDFSLDGKYIYTGAPYEMYKIRATDGVNLLTMTNKAHQNYPTTLFKFNNDSKLISCGVDGFVKIWNSNDLVNINEINLNNASVFDLALSKDDKLFATCGRDSGYYVFSTDTYSMEKYNKISNETFFSIAISPDNKKIVTGGENSIIKVWDYETGKLLKELKGHTGYITRLKFTKGGIS